MSLRMWSPRAPAEEPSPGNRADEDRLVRSDAEAAPLRGDSSTVKTLDAIERIVQYFGEVVPVVAPMTVAVDASEGSGRCSFPVAWHCDDGDAAGPGQLVHGDTVVRHVLEDVIAQDHVVAAVRQIKGLDVEAWKVDVVAVQVRRVVSRRGQPVPEELLQLAFRSEVQNVG